MKRNHIGVLCIVLVMAMSILSGCSTDIISIGVADTPTPQVVDRPLQGVQTIPVTTTTSVIPEGTVAATLTPSPECRDLLSATEDDRAFMNAMSDKEVYAGICSLADGDCTISSATRISQEISTNPKPKTLLLAQAREKLLSAATYCLDPENSATRARVRDDLDVYIGRLSRYAFLVSSCGDRSGEEIAALLKKTVEKQGETLLRGTGSDVQSFSTRGYANTTLSFAYTGSSSFVVMLQDADIKNIELIANCAGTCEGKRSIGLENERYQVNVTATGPWSVLVIVPE